MILRLFLIFPFCLQALIIESNSLHCCLSHVEKNTLIICDIDNTLIESCQQLGTVQWAEHLMKSLKDGGMPLAKVLEIEQQAWLDIQPKISMRLVAEDTAEVLQEFKKKGYFCIALTARDFQETQETEEQLKSCAIELSSLHTKRWERMVKGQRILFEKGVLYASHNLKKSEALEVFLKELPCMPSKIIFVDDKQKHVEDIESLAHKWALKFIGIRFNAADKRVSTYNPEVARLQWEMLPLYLSDDEAKKRLS